MEYNTVEGKRLFSKNNYSQGYRYVKSRESSTIIHLKCALFRSHSCQSFAKIDKISNLLEVTKIHNHSECAHNSDKIVLCNNIKRGAEISTANLREIFNDCCRNSDVASSLTFKDIESTMCKRRRILQPKIPSSALEFDTLLKDSLYSANHLTTAIDQGEMSTIFGSNCMLNFIMDSPNIQFDGYVLRNSKNLFTTLHAIHSGE